jgi:PAS domain S-box-containing protein
MDTTDIFSKQLQQAQEVLENAYEELQEHFTELVAVNTELRQEIIEHQKIEKALIKSQQRYENLVNSIDGVVWEAEPKTFQFTFISQQAKRFFGYPLEDWLENSTFWAEHIHPDDKAWVIDYCATATAKKKDHDFEYRMITADNRTIWIRDIVTVVVENGQAVKLCGVMLDITKQKQSEEKLSIFQKFIENSNEGMGMATLDGKIAYLNPTLCRFVDEPQLEDVIDKPFTDYYPEHLQKHFQTEILPQIMQTGQWQGETALISAKGKMINTFESFFMLRDSNEKPLYVSAVISDITERKHTEVALKKANDALKALTECRQVLIHAKDESTLLNDICRVLVQNVGYQLVWIGFAEEDDNKTVRPIAQSGYEEGYLETIRVSWGNNQYGKGPTGTAIRTGKPCLAHNILNDPKYAPWRQQAIQRGYASSMAIPLNSHHQILGALNVYAVEPHAFDAETVKWFEDLAADLVYGMTVLRISVERQQMEEKLISSEERFRKIFEDGPVGMVMAALDHQIIKVNAAFCRILGYSESELLNLKIADVSYPEDMPVNKELIQQALKGEIASYQMEKRYLKKDGNLVWGNLTVSFFRDGQGNPLYFLAVVEDITERKQAVEKLRESEERFRKIFEEGPVGMALTTTDYRFLKVNKAFCQFLQYTETEFSQLTILDITYPEDIANSQTVVNQFLSGHISSLQIEKRYLTKHRRIVWGNLTVSVYRNENQEIPYFISIIEDITERKQAEDALQTLNEHLSSIVDSLPVIPYTCQAKGDFGATYVGKNIDEVTGYTAEQFTSEPAFWAKHIHPDDQAHVLKNLSTIFETGHHEHEYRFQMANGSYKWFSDILRLIKTSSGEISHLAGVWQDITERKKFEARLRESETRIRTILDNVVDGVITINEQGMITSFNPAAEQIFGYSLDEVNGKNVSLLMPAPYRSQHKNYINNYKSTGIAKIIGIGREVEGQHKDGSVFPLDLAVGEMWLGQQRMFIGVVRNITERKHAEMALKNAKEVAESANRAKSEFLANMSHEIRTPLNAVIGFSELLSSIITDKKQKNYLDSIQTAGKSLLTLINDILDLSKIEAGRLDIQYESINPYIIFHELQQIFALKIAEKNLEFLVDIDPQLPNALLLDETRLRQVLLNLIGNAVKFTDTGYIKLTAQKIDQSNEQSKIDLIISVTDTGIGIPENQQAIIFESFRQQDGQSSRKYGGTGLGLAITKRLVEMMNGQISLQSQEGKGSVFEIRLRKVEVSAVDIVENSDEHLNFQNIRFDGAKVLVVDDIKSNRSLIKEYFSTVNLEMIEAKNGLEAFIFAEEYHPALILMDIRMPEMDGYEATKKIKANLNTGDIPIIALTASVSISEKNKLEIYGFDGYLSKPVNSSLLFNEISRYLTYTTKKIASKLQIQKEDNIPIEIVEVATLCQTLEDKMLPLWQELVDMIETDAIENFAEQLIQLSKKHQAQCLIDYAENLRELAQKFDIEGIEQALEQFPARLNSLM